MSDTAEAIPELFANISNNAQATPELSTNVRTNSGARLKHSPTSISDNARALGSKTEARPEHSPSISDEGRALAPLEEGPSNSIPAGEGREVNERDGGAGRARGEVWVGQGVGRGAEGERGHDDNGLVAAVAAVGSQDGVWCRNDELLSESPNGVFPAACRQGEVFSERPNSVFHVVPPESVATVAVGGRDVTNSEDGDEVCL